MESILGDTVVAASSQSGGFSPGTADRVRTAGGGRAFVKAVSAARNEQSVVMHRREGRVTAAMPGWAPVPELLGRVDDGDWVALVLRDVEGRHPRTPWRSAELRKILAVLDAFAARATPAALPDSRTAQEMFAEDFGGWRRIAADPPPGLDPWVAGHLDELRASADRALAVLDGDTLVHTDLRADNILCGADGTVTLIDWPSACRGPSWLDSLLLLINVALHGGHDMHTLLLGRADAHSAPVEDLLSVLAAMTGFFADAARCPPPPGLPTLRAFQWKQAEAGLAWLRAEAELTGLPG